MTSDDAGRTACGDVECGRRHRLRQAVPSMHPACTSMVYSIPYDRFHHCLTLRLSDGCSREFWQWL